MVVEVVVGGKQEGGEERDGLIWGRRGERDDAILASTGVILKSNKGNVFFLVQER